MKVGRWEIRRRVLIGGGAVVLAIVGSLLRIGHGDGGHDSAQSGNRPRIYVSGVNGNQLLADEADLVDPSPLFFPTGRNYGQNAVAANLRRLPDEGFRNFEPRYRFSDQNPGNFGREAVSVPDRLADVLEQGAAVPFAGIGEVDRVRRPLPERNGFIEVKTLQDGVLVHESVVENSGFPTGDFAPMEFIVSVGPAGMIGEPLLATNSGSDSVDVFVRNFLAKTYRLGDRLPPGIYRVAVGP